MNHTCYFDQRNKPKVNTLQDTDHDKLAELKYMCKFTAHGIFEVFCFCLCHLTT